MARAQIRQQRHSHLSYWNAHVTLQRMSAAAGLKVRVRLGWRPVPIAVAAALKLTNQAPTPRPCRKRKKAHQTGAPTPQPSRKRKKAHPTGAPHVQVATEDAWFEGPHPVSPEWTVALRVRPSSQGVPVITELRLFPSETWPDRPAGTWSGEYRGIEAECPAGGVTARLVHSLKVGLLYRQERDLLARLRRAERSPDDHAAHTALVQRMLPGAEIPAPDSAERFFDEAIGKRVGVPSSSPSGRKRGPKGRPERFYLELAEQYANLWANGSRRPTADLARLRRCSLATMRDQIHTARERKLLTGQWGRPGGRLTPHATDLLRSKPRGNGKAAKAPRR
jgi:hypothetical protein